MKNRAKIYLIFTGILVVLLFAAGCNQKADLEKLRSEGGQASSTADPKSEAEETAGDASDSQATPAENDKEASGDAGQPAATAKGQIAVIKTNKGIIKFELYPDVAPNTVANFVKLANDGFYNGSKWHRVVEDFVIQGGDPNSKDDDPSDDGGGGPGYEIDAEFSSKKHLEGTVAMARAPDPNSAGSQFYICLSPQPSLDNNYTIFGQVIEGMDVVHKISGYQEQDGKIVQFDVMETVTIEDQK